MERKQTILIKGTPEWDAAFLQISIANNEGTGKITNAQNNSPEKSERKPVDHTLVKIPNFKLEA